MKHRVPPTIDVPAKSGGFVAREHARVVVTWRAPHVELAPRLEAIVGDALALVGDVPLAYPRPSGDWLDPMPRAKVMARVRKEAKGQTNANLDLSTLDQPETFALEYRGFLPGWIDGSIGRSPRGRVSFLALRFARERLYADPEAMRALLERLLGHAPFAAGTVGLALSGNHREVYPRALEHLALDISSVGSVTSDVGDAVHGLGWLTALGDGVVARIGGDRRIRRALGKAATVTEVPHGLLVQLGAVPSRGSTEPHAAPYRAFAKLLGAELHVPRSVGYITCGFYDGTDRYAGRADEMQVAWHRRFVITRKALAAPFTP